MEEQILEILDKNTNNWRKFKGDCFDNSAKEITAHVRENYYEKAFVRWLQKWSHPFGRVENIDILLYVNFNEGSKKQYTLEEVYTYWLINVKNKE